MTREEQRTFVTSLTNSIKVHVLEHIEQGRIPENWDRFELRQLLADEFAASTGFLEGNRKKEYRNTVLVNNLYSSPTIRSKPP